MTFGSLLVKPGLPLASLEDSVKRPDYINSMAESRYDMKGTLSRYTGELFDHLLLLIYFKGNPSYNHWRGECFGFLPQYLKVFKDSHRYPSLDFIEQWVYLHLIDSDGVFNAFRDRVGYKGLFLPLDFGQTYDRAMLKIGNILHKVCLILHEDHKILPEQFYAILDQYDL
jgi:hypothetical protein